MGVNISEIIPKEEIELKDLKGKKLAIDAYNTLYQFLTTIRQPDGTPLMDSKGNITSHLSGLFYRNINLLMEGIKPVYVFDGQPPELKYKEIKKRSKTKKEAKAKYEESKEKEDVEGMKKYAGRSVSITKEVLEESKELLEAMGIPVVQAPGEGEAEAAHLANQGKVWAAASQDFDSLLYGVPYLVRNLTLARRRRTSAGNYVDVKPELIEFEKVLNRLQINKDQLIALAILVGTDYNPGGVRGLGQKRAIEIVQKYKYPVEIFKHIDMSKKYEMTFDWQEIFKLFHEYNSNQTEEIEFKKFDEKKVKEFLLKREFSENRIDSGIQKLNKIEEQKKQKGLGDFL